MSENPPEEVVVVITWTPRDGSVKVDGPMRNEPIMFWLLDKAKKIVEMANMRPEPPRIAPAPRGFDPHKLGP